MATSNGDVTAGADKGKVKPKRPSDSAFKQQKLKAWQPVMTASTVIPAFFILGLAFIPIGIGLWFTSEGVLEKEIDYTDCLNVGGEKCEEVMIRNASQVACSCTIGFELDALYKGPVFVYYGLSNFYQNHRRYVKSRDDNQLSGQAFGSYSDLSPDCEPYREESGTGKYYAPCGAIANSMFNDTFELKYNVTTMQFVMLSKKGIAWSTDVDVKFKNPANNFSGSAKPINWRKSISELEGGYQNEDFIVWMRTAALPNFRKLYGKVQHNGVFEDGLPKGQYVLDVDYAYPVSSFDGRKRLVITMTSWIGGKNPFLGIAYMSVGALCMILGIIFLFINLKFNKKMVDLTVSVPEPAPFSIAR